MATTITAVAKQTAAIQTIRARLQKAESFDEVKAIRDQAEALRSYIQSAKLGLELQNDAAELRAERRAGQFLASLHLRGGDRRSNSHDGSLKLSDMGLSHNESANWQKEASVPEELFENFLARAKRQGEEITTAFFLRLARKLAGSRKVSLHRHRGELRLTLDDAAQSVPLEPGTAGALDEVHQHLKMLLSIIERICDDEAVPIRRVDLPRRGQRGDWWVPEYQSVYTQQEGSERVRSHSTCTSFLLCRAAGHGFKRRNVRCPNVLRHGDRRSGKARCRRQG